MDQNDQLKELVRFLIQENIITVNENGDIDFRSPASSAEQNNDCICTKGRSQEVLDRKEAITTCVVNLLWQVIPYFKIAGVASYIIPLLKPIVTRRITPNELTQILMKIIPLLKNKFQIQGKNSK